MFRLADPGERHRLYAMPGQQRTRAAVRAIEGAPSRLAALARAAKVPQSTLARIVSGERGASVAVTQALARTLRRWARECEAQAIRLEATLREEN